MSFTISYRSLCTIDILHHFFLDEGMTDFDALPADQQQRRLAQYQVERVFRIQPDQATRQILAGHRMRLVQQAQGLRVMVQTRDDGRPLLVPDTDLTLRVGLFLQDSRFWNYTALRLSPSFHALAEKNQANRLFYFSNAAPYAGAVTPALPALHRPAPAFVASGNYAMGDRVAVGANRFEARRDILNSIAPDQPASGWQPLLPARDYVGHADELRFRGASFHYFFTQPNITAQLQIRNGADQVVWSETGVQSFPDHRTFRVAPKDLAPGYYRLLVDDGAAYQETQDFFYHPEWYGQGLFGVIELKLPGLLNDGGGNPADEGLLLSPAYQLRFRNRSTVWRYRSSRTQAVIGGVTGADTPLPLTAVSALSPQLNARELPRPQPDVIIPDAGDAVIYSDVFIDEQLFA